MLNSLIVPVVPYLDYWDKVFNLNESFTTAVHERADACGYTDYIEKYLTFPPPGPFPTPTNSSDDCDVFDDVFAAALEVNKCFNIYHILDTCPHLFNVLGIVNTGDYFPPGAQVYFNRSDVQAAINAPPTNWMQCTDTNVFGGPSGTNPGDESLGPAQDGVLQHVIESTNNTIIGVGGLDYLLPINGTLLAIQNMTWNGLQGFQTPPETDFFVPYHPEYNGGSLAGAGILGNYVYERGLTFYTVELAGHGMLCFIFLSGSDVDRPARTSRVCTGCCVQSSRALIGENLFAEPDWRLHYSDWEFHGYDAVVEARSLRKYPTESYWRCVHGMIGKGHCPLILETYTERPHSLQ